MRYQSVYLPESPGCLLNEIKNRSVTKITLPYITSIFSPLVLTSFTSSLLSSTLFNHVTLTFLLYALITKVFGVQLNKWMVIKINCIEFYYQPKLNSVLSRIQSHYLPTKFSFSTVQKSQNFGNIYLSSHVLNITNIYASIFKFIRSVSLYCLYNILQSCLYYSETVTLIL